MSTSVSSSSQNASPYPPHYYPLPPPNYTSSASTYAPSSTPIRSIATLKPSRIDNDPTNDELEGGDVEAGNVGVKKWSVEEAKWMITAWINTSARPVTGAD